MFERRQRRSLAVDLLGGLASGMFASWVMERAHKRPRTLGGRKVLEHKRAVGSEPSTVKAAEAAARPLGLSLDERQKKKGGKLVH